MIKATPLAMALLALMAGGYSNADELTTAADGLCDKIKTCALEVVAGPDLTDSLRQEMDAVLAQSCARMRNRVQAVPASHDLYQPAVTCLRSMAALDCPYLHNSGGVKTPECAAYDGLANPVTGEEP